MVTLCMMTNILEYAGIACWRLEYDFNTIIFLSVDYVEYYDIRMDYCSLGKIRH